jgi:hypothetical protein
MKGREHMTENETSKRFVCTMPMVGGIELVLHMSAEKTYHRDWVLYDMHNVTIKADVVCGGHTIQSEKYGMKTLGQWDEQKAYEVADECIKRLRFKMKVQEEGRKK